ncbi:MAG: hypothetical protein NC190_08165 [Bacteroides sp.]|nr:hypothetical protein [Bacteroides sp.]
MTAEQKEELIAAYNVESSRDLDTHDLVDLCGKLSKQAGGKKRSEYDRLRKQCMAAIGSWLKMCGKESNATVIKAIACRATKHDDFNKIPLERLRNLVYLFNNKIKDQDAVDDVAEQVEAVKEAAKKIFVYRTDNGLGFLN